MKATVEQQPGCAECAGPFTNVVESCMLKFCSVRCAAANYMRYRERVSTSAPAPEDE